MARNDENDGTRLYVGTRVTLHDARYADPDDDVRALVCNVVDTDDGVVNAIYAPDCRTQSLLAVERGVGPDEWTRQWREV